MSDNIREACRFLAQALEHMNQSTTVTPTAGTSASIISRQSGNNSGLGSSPIPSPVAVLTNPMEAAESSSLTSSPSGRFLTVQSEMSNRFAPYPVVAAPGVAGNYSASLASIRNRMQAVASPRGRGVVAIPNAKAKVELSRELILLGDPNETHRPDTARKQELWEKGLNRTLLFLKTHRGASADELKSDVKKSISVFPEIDWDLLHAQGSGSNQRLIGFQIPPSASDITALSTRRFYARPNIVICPLEIDADGADEEGNDVEAPVPSLSPPSSATTSAAVSDVVGSSGGFRFAPTAEQERYLSMWDLEDFRTSTIGSNPGTTHLYVQRKCDNVDALNTVEDLGGTTNSDIATDDVTENTISIENVLDWYTPSRNLFTTLRVHFKGEDGWDIGGLTREFFYQSQLAITNNSYKGCAILEGQHGHYLPSSDAFLEVEGVLPRLARFMVHSCFNIGFFFCGMSHVVKQFIFLQDVSDVRAIEIKDNDLPCAETRTLLHKLRSYQQSPNQFDQNSLTDLRTQMLSWNLSLQLSPENIETIIQLLKYTVVISRRRAQLNAIRETIRNTQLYSFLNFRKDLVFTTFIRLNEVPIQVEEVIDAFNNASDPDYEQATVLLRTYLTSLLDDGIPLSKFLVWISNLPVIIFKKLSFEWVPAGRMVSTQSCSRILFVPYDITQAKFNSDLNLAIFVSPLSFSMM